MNYIVSPFYVYLLGLVGPIKTFLIIITGVIAMAILILYGVKHDGYDTDIQDVAKYFRVGAWQNTNSTECRINAENALKELGELKEDIFSYRRLMKALIILGVITALACVFIPSKETLIEMKIASYATYDNAAIAAQQIKQAADYIVDAVRALK